jgi:hypothetical protein
MHKIYAKKHLLLLIFEFLQVDYIYILLNLNNILYAYYSLLRSRSTPRPFKNTLNDSN